MKATRTAGYLFVSFFFCCTAYSFAQDLGTHFKKIKDGIYVSAGQLSDANVTIIQTQEGRNDGTN